MKRNLEEVKEEVEVKEEPTASSSRCLHDIFGCPKPPPSTRTKTVPTDAKTAAKTIPKRAPKAKATATASSMSDSSAPKRSKAVLDQFGFRQRNAPPQVQARWAVLKDFPDGDPEREAFIDKMLAVKRGDYKDLELSVKDEFEDTNGAVLML